MSRSFTALVDGSTGSQQRPVASRAKVAAQYRAVFARRFTAVLGETPLSHARRWRLFHARRLLRTTNASLDDVAARVGHGSAAALSLALSRAVGVRPGVDGQHPRSEPC